MSSSSRSSTAIVSIAVISIFIIYVCIYHHNTNRRLRSWLLPKLRAGLAHLSARTTPTSCPPDPHLIPPPYTFELVVPVEPDGHELFHMLLPSILFFWPRSRTNLLVVTDAGIGEKRRRNFTREFDRRTGVLNRSRIVFAEPSSVYRGDILYPRDTPKTDGWYRQLWIRLWADNFTAADFIGFSDTDSLMTTVPMPGDIFAVDTTTTTVKPVVHCQYFHHPTTPPLLRYQKRTVEALQRSVVLDCGTFPLVFRRQHLQLFRAHIIRLHNYTTFDAFFTVFQRRSFSEFMLLFNYLWYYHRSNYDWHIMPVATDPLNRLAWTLMRRPLAMSILNVSRTALLPKARVAQHYTYITKSPRDIMRSGRCHYLVALRVEAPNCGSIIPNGTVVDDLAYFYEGIKWNDRPEVDESYRKRISLIRTTNYRRCWDLSLVA